MTGTPKQSVRSGAAVEQIITPKAIQNICSGISPKRISLRATINIFKPRNRIGLGIPKSMTSGIRKTDANTKLRSAVGKSVITGAADKRISPATTLDQIAD